MWLLQSTQRSYAALLLLCLIIHIPRVLKKIGALIVWSRWHFYDNFMVIFSILKTMRSNRFLSQVHAMIWGPCISQQKGLKHIEQILIWALFNTYLNHLADINQNAWQFIFCATTCQLNSIVYDSACITLIPKSLPILVIFQIHVQAT